MMFWKRSRLLVVAIACLFVIDMASAAVSVRQAGTNLIITGDREANFVGVSVDQAFGVIFVSFSEDIFFVEDVKKIIVRTLGGDDVVDVYQYSDFGPELALNVAESLPQIDLEINTSVGDDDVYVSGDWGKTRIITSGGEDVVELYNVGEEGGDIFGFEPTLTRFVDLYVSTGGADDSIYSADIVVGDYNATGVSGVLRSRFTTGGGNDVVSIFGYDTATPESGRVVKTQVLAGGGDDEVSIAANLQERDTLNGGGGRNDCLELSVGGVEPADLIVRGFEEESCDGYVVVLP